MTRRTPIPVESKPDQHTQQSRENNVYTPDRNEAQSNNPSGNIPKDSDQNLFRLAYISRNAIAGDRSAIQSEIQKILATAHSNNPLQGITGALLYSGGFFCQVIEGGQTEIEDLFESIQMDARHADVTVLHFERVQERGFNEWAMAFAGIEESMRFDLDQIKSSKDELAMRDVGRDLAKVLEDIVEQNQRTLG